MLINNDANEITVQDIEDLLNGNVPESSTEEVKVEGQTATQPNDAERKVTETKAFAHRLKEEKQKVVKEERNNIAKSLGYESYEALQKSQEEKLLKDTGADIDDIAPVVEKIVQQRLENDPRLKELDEYRQEKINAWAKKELAELNELTGGKVTKLEDLPKNVIELWKTEGSLKSAYLKLEGERLIREFRGEQTKGSTAHLATPKGEPAPKLDPDKRPYTQQEKDVYKLFNPNTTEEQLSKLLKDK